MLPSISWKQIVRKPEPVYPRHWETPIDGNMPPTDLEVLCRLVKHVRPKRIFEIGSFEGRTTYNLALHAPHRAVVHTLDLLPIDADHTKLPLDLHDRKYVPPFHSRRYFRDSPRASQIQQIYGDSATFNFKPYEGQMDFVLVDGSHSYHYVLNDAWAALRMARSRGMIVWHDYSPNGQSCWPGLVRALDELQERHADFRGIRHIEGTALAVLPFRAPWRVRWFPRFAAEWRAKRTYVRTYRDSRETTGLLAELQVKSPSTRVPRGSPIAVEVQAQNTGSAAWLPHRTLLGPVRVGCHLLSAEGKVLDLDYARYTWTARSEDVTLPGESRSLKASIPAPPPGRYMLEFDLVAEGVCWFARNGSPTARIPVEVT